MGHYYIAPVVGFELNYSFVKSRLVAAHRGITLNQTLKWKEGGEVNGCGTFSAFLALVICIIGNIPVGFRNQAFSVVTGSYRTADSSSTITRKNRSFRVPDSFSSDGDSFCLFLLAGELMGTGGVSSAC